MITETQKYNKDIAPILPFIEDILPEKIIINMSGVNSLKTSVLQKLKNISKEKEIFLYALEAEMHAIINMLGIDKHFHIFPDKESCLENKYEIKNRKFKVV